MLLIKGNVRLTDSLYYRTLGTSLGSRTSLRSLRRETRQDPGVVPQARFAGSSGDEAGTDPLTTRSGWPGLGQWEVTASGPSPKKPSRSRGGVVTGVSSTIDPSGRVSADISRIRSVAKGVPTWWHRTGWEMMGSPTIST
jgi:hypothetical protein